MLKNCQYSHGLSPEGMLGVDGQGGLVPHAGFCEQVKDLMGPGAFYGLSNTLLFSQH